MMKYIILLNLFFSLSIMADEFCDSNPEEVLREQFCKKPSEVLCNGNININLNAIKEAVRSVESSYEAVYAREYLEARRIYLERNGISGSEHLIASVPVSDLNSCHPSSSDDEEVCEESDSYYIEHPFSYYERQPSGGIENFRHRYRSRQYRLFDEMTSEYYDSLLGNSEQVEEFVWDLVFEIIDEYKEKIKAADIFTEEELEKRFQKIEQDIEDSSLILRPVGSKENSKSSFASKGDKTFFEICKMGGLVPNAAVIETSPASILVCPGFYAHIPGVRDALLTEKTKSRLRGVLSFTLAHELGHLIEGRLNNNDITSLEYKEPLLAKSFLQCVKENYDLTDDMKNNFGKYKRELIADMAAYTQFAGEIKGKSVREAIKILRSGESIFCLTMNDHEKHKDDKSEPNHHPPSSFRVDQLLLKYPEVFKSMGCGKFHKGKSIVGCGLKGAEILQLGL